MRIMPTRLALSTLLLVLSGTAARADQISWSNNWVSSPTAISADVGPSGSPGTGTVFLLDPQPGTGTGSMHVNGTQFGVNTSALPTAPDHFTNKAFSLNLTLTDAASGAKGVLTFAGLLNATMSTGGVNVSTSFPDGTAKSVTLGGNTFNATLDSFTQPTLTTPGGFGAQVTVAAGTPPPPPPPPPPAPPPPPPPSPPPSTNTPEPSTCVLAGLGVSLAGLASRRKPRWKDAVASVA
jgi:hypothetical protein